MMALLFRAALAVGFVATGYAVDAPGIRRVETQNFSNLRAPVQNVYVGPGRPAKEYFIYGPWMDYADKVTFLGSSQPIVEKKALFNADGGLLRVKLSAPAGTTRGVRNATIHISCPLIPGTDCRTGNVNLPVMVLNIGTLSGIDPRENVPVGQPVVFNITGTGLNVAEVNTFYTDLNNVQVLSRTPGTMQIRGTPKGCGTIRVVLGDEAEGGEFYRYSPGGLDVKLATDCGYRPVPPPATYGQCPAGKTFNPTTKTCN